VEKINTDNLVSDLILKIIQQITLNDVSSSMPLEGIKETPE